MTNNNPGCLGFLLGYRSSNTTPQVESDTAPDSAGHEGNIHSGPGGYEGMGYSGGYAAEYFDDSHDSEHQ
jgi:hypothetical protein